MYPLSLFFVLIFGMFTLKSHVGEIEEVDNVRVVFIYLSYFIAVCSAIKNPLFFFETLKKVWPLVILTIFTGVSLLWSYYPKEVAKFFFHMVGLLFVASNAAYLCLNDVSKIYKTIFFSTFIVILLSILVVFNMPIYGITYFSNNDLYSLIPRWNGITPHPNSLGVFCVVAIWSGLCWREYHDGMIARFVLLCLTLCALFIAVYGCQSMTSTVVGVVIFVMFFCINKSRFSPIFSFIFLFILGSCLLLVFSFILKLINRDATFTGRTELWYQALEVIIEKPFLGWGFDSGASVLSTASSDIIYSSFHNGYLQVIVLGGVIGFVLLLISLFKMFKVTVSCNKLNPLLSFSFFSILVAIGIQNITESFFLTPLTSIWVSVVSLWVVCEHQCSSNCRVL